MKTGDRIGCYDVIRLLGRGGMSEVYEVENHRLGSRHALKLFACQNEDNDLRERFQREGRLLARLNHPRIVRVTDFGADETCGRPYFVMDLVVNAHGGLQLLSDVEPGTVDEDQIGIWYDDLREGLAYIHANGVVHRDLKMQNVLIGPDGHAVLTDFGIARIFARGDGQKIVDMTQTLVKLRDGRRLVMGSIGYMAPELEMGVAASPQSDWYALGVIVYRLLTGTWCEARTDIAGALETYDPAWQRILPKLLHTNPSGRDCPSFAEEKRADRNRADFEAEERLLDASRWRRLSCFLVGLLAAALVTVAMLGLGVSRSVPDFDSVFAVPESANREDVEESEFFGALNDALVLTHDLFGKLKDGEVSQSFVRDEFLRWAKAAREDDLTLPPSGGDNKGLAILLEEAAGRLDGGEAK